MTFSQPIHGSGVFPVDNIPSIELLEATHTFPGPYTFKVIGHSADDFVARVVEAVRDELQASDDPQYGVRQTSAGAQVSITLTPYIDSADQVQAIYRRIGILSGLIMLL
jgi:putative lipoic acid-binding regulatory protein